MFLRADLKNRDRITGQVMMSKVARICPVSCLLASPSYFYSCPNVRWFFFNSEGIPAFPNCFWNVSARMFRLCVLRSQDWLDLTFMIETLPTPHYYQKQIGALNYLIIFTLGRKNVIWGWRWARATLSAHVPRARKEMGESYGTGCDLLQFKQAMWSSGVQFWGRS